MLTVERWMDGWMDGHECCSRLNGVCCTNANATSAQTGQDGNVDMNDDRRPRVHTAATLARLSISCCRQHARLIGFAFPCQPFTFFAIGDKLTEDDKVEEDGAHAAYEPG